MSNDTKRKSNKSGRSGKRSSNRGNSTAVERGSQRADDPKRRAHFRGADAYSTESDNPSVDTKCNDLEWYVKDVTMLLSGANFSYAYPLGGTYEMDNSATDDVAGNISITGIQALRVAPILGCSLDRTSPLNQGIRKMYTYIRHANSGAKNYDPADLGMYLGAMDSIYTYYWYGVRAYGMIMNYSPVNRFYPAAMLAATGWDFDDLIENAAVLRYGLNVLASQINNLVVPDTLSLFKRHRWLFSGMYTDGTTAKAQTYLYVPDGVYKFAYDAQSAGKLNYTPLHRGEDDGKFLTVSEYLNTLNDLINPIITQVNEDFSTISGDIMKAYDVNQLYKLPFVAENYTVKPVYAEEVLSQIQNATILPYYVDPNTKTRDVSSFDVTQVVDVDAANAGALICKPTVRGVFSVSKPTGYTSYTDITKSQVLGLSRMSVGAANKIITLNLSDPNPGDTMVATRLTVMTGKPEFVKARATVPAEDNRFIIEYDLPIEFCGTELVIGAYLWNLTTPTSTNKHGFHIRYYDMDYRIGERRTILDGNVTAYGAPVEAIEDYSSLIVRNSHCRFHPLVTAIVNTITAKFQTEMGAVNLDEINCLSAKRYYHEEIDMFTGLSRNEVKQLHEMAVLAEFDI